MERRGCELKSARFAFTTLLFFACVAAAEAQVKPRPPVALKTPPVRQERVRVSINAGQQANSTMFAEEQQFDHYFEEGSFTLERPFPAAFFYDAGAMVRVWRRLHAGGAVSLFENTGDGSVTARVPHPLFFGQNRSVNGEVSDVSRLEIGQHISAGWLVRAPRNVSLMLFGGPSLFFTKQRFVTELQLSLSQETYPFDTLAFPPVSTEQLSEIVLGYHAGVDATWRFARRFGVGAVIRYAKGRKDFMPTGGTPVELEVGGLHAGGGIRFVF